MQNSIPLLDLAENISIACDVFWRKQYFLRILNKNFEREGCQKKNPGTEIHFRFSAFTKKKEINSKKKKFKK